MVYFACTNKLNCSAERERGDGGGLQFQLPCAWWSFTKNILNSFSRIHNDPRRSKVKYHEFWQLHWQRSWAQSEGWGPCVCVAGSWKFELVCLGLSDWHGVFRILGAFLKSHTWSRSAFKLGSILLSSSRTCKFYKLSAILEKQDKFF